MNVYLNFLVWDATFQCPICHSFSFVLNSLTYLELCSTGLWQGSSATVNMSPLCIQTGCSIWLQGSVKKIRCNLKAILKLHRAFSQYNTGWLTTYCIVRWNWITGNIFLSCKNHTFRYGLNETVLNTIQLKPSMLR